MKQRTPGYIFIPLTLFAVLVAFMMVIPVELETKEGFVGMLSYFWQHFMFILTKGIVWAVFAIALIMLIVINALNKVVEGQKFKKLSPEEQKEYLAISKQGYFSRLLNSGYQRQSEEEEQVLIIDHDYDGITELDNSLPQWWLSLFYFGFAFTIVYLLAYGFTDFADTNLEYEVETEQLETKFEAWRAANDITIDGAVNKYKDPDIIAQGKELFENDCTQCHMKNGGGGIGPNLTDGYWVTKAQDSLFYNIYDIVYNGSPTNAQMKAFGQRKDLSGLAIEKVAAYVYYMNQVADPVTKGEGGADPQGNEVPQWARGK